MTEQETEEDVIHFKDTLLYKRYSELYEKLQFVLKEWYGIMNDTKRYNELKYYFLLCQGFFMIFFGGHFSLVLAAHEAFVKSSSEKVMMPLRKIWNEHNERCKDASENIWSWNNFLNNSDPIDMWDALSGLGSGLMAILATLKLDFLHATSLGVSIGDKVGSIVDKYVRDAWNNKVNKSVKRRWLPVLHKSFFRVCGFILAFCMYKLIYAIRCGVKGMELLKTQFQKSGLISEDTVSFSYFLYSFFVIGIYTQYNNDYTTPFPVNAMLFPLEMAEHILESICMYH